MATYVVGFSRLASVAMGTISGRQGMTLWYGLMGLRLVALFVADHPWTDLRADFICNGSLSTYCWASCFNAHFNFPMDVLWDFSYVLAAMPVACLYQISPRLRPPKGTPLEETSATSPLPQPSVSGRGPKERDWLTWAAVVSVCALVAIEVVFLWVIAWVQLPLVSPASIQCVVPPSCSPASPVECVLHARAEKLAAMGVLAFASGFNILVGLVYIGMACLAECWHRM
uniref:uncharacterized protein gjz1 n=1 Tax=Pristiophorus japonicus TaxID=55135 RepID=UPI00398EB081